MNKILVQIVTYSMNEHDFHKLPIPKYPIVNVLQEKSSLTKESNFLKCHNTTFGKRVFI